VNILRLCACVLASTLLVAVESHAQEESTVIVICAVCHGEDGSGAGFADVPIIAGTPAAHIEEAIYAYQDGARLCINETAMCEAAFQLSDDDVAEAADHFAAQKRVSSEEPYVDRLAMKGRRLHRQHCIRCHVRPDDERAAEALGIPLHGQRSAYLEYAFESYLNGNRQTLIPEMAEKLALLTRDDIEALINFYASYKP
jgi:cytochrome c553